VKFGTGYLHLILTYQSLGFSVVWCSVMWCVFHIQERKDSPKYSYTISVVGECASVHICRMSSPTLN